MSITKLDDTNNDLDYIYEMDVVYSQDIPDNCSSRIIPELGHREVQA